MLSNSISELTTSRRIGQTIQIGENILIIVKDIQRNQVRLGIRAPKSVLITRGEECQLKKNHTTK